MSNVNHVTERERSIEGGGTVTKGRDKRARQVIYFTSIRMERDRLYHRVANIIHLLAGSKIK